MDGNTATAARFCRSLSLILPAYNEETIIQQAVREADEVLREHFEAYEILVVDDGSTDGTADTVRKLTAVYPRLRLLSHPRNQGYGSALRTGFAHARFEYVGFTDADCQFDLHDLGKLQALTAEAPVVAGRRVRRQDPWRRRLYSHGYNWLVRAMLGTHVRDCDCALKVFRRQALAEILPESNGFFVNAEMLTRARLQGLRVLEVGVRHRPRGGGKSKVSLADVPRTLATLLPFWWSRVLFPANGNGPTPASHDLRSLPPARWPDHVGLGIVAMFALIMFFSRLNGPLLEPDEARYAEIPRQMLAAGEVVLPTLHGQTYSHKPPLLYWLVMGSYTAFGISDWAARLMPCAAGFVMVIATYLWGRRAVGNRAALFGALMLCLSARFVYLGRMLTMDGLLALWVVAAWATAHVAIQRGTWSWRWWLASAVACGLGVLTKGPVALVLVAVPVVVCQLLDRRTARPGLLPWLTYVGGVALVALPWYVAVAFRDSTFLVDFFWTHNVRRYVSPLDHEEPFWYFIPGLVLGMLPWTLLLPALWKLLTRRFGVKARRRPAGLGLVLLAGAWCLLFYSAGGCKRPGYIIPTMPPLALALGYTLHSLLPRNVLSVVRTAAGRRHARLAYHATLLVLGGGMAISIAALISGILEARAALVLVGLTLAAGAFLVSLGPLQRLASMWGTCGVATFVTLLVGLHQLLPGYERRFSLREQVQPQLDLARASNAPVVCYPRRWDSVSFYLDRDDVRVFAAEARLELIRELRHNPGTILFVKSDSPHEAPLRELLRDLPAFLEFVPYSRHGMVTAGVVRRRPEAPAIMLVRKDTP